jgi:LmeA-like phospholipid-binding
VSDGSTRRLPAPPVQREPSARRGYRRAVIILIAVLGLIAILIGLDRAAAAYAENRVASQLTNYGFPTKPSVTIEGFPFLTQVISKRIGSVNISARRFHAGPVTASISARATGVSLHSGYSSGTIASITGTGLIPFPELARIARARGAPGLKLSAAGPHEVKLKADLHIVSATALARILQTGPDRFTIHIISAGSIPLSLLGPVQNLSIQIPSLPLGLHVRSVTAAAKGVVVHVTAHHVPFGQ